MLPQVQQAIAELDQHFAGSTIETEDEEQGGAYVVVHDLCIHGRTGRAVGSSAYVRWVRDAHAVHHRYGREPYGFLLPLIPAELRGDPPAVTDVAGRRNDEATVASLRASGTRARRVKTS